jgi:hypothetical protein
VARASRINAGLVYNYTSAVQNNRKAIRKKKRKIERKWSTFPYSYTPNFCTVYVWEFASEEPSEDMHAWCGCWSGGPENRPRRTCQCCSCQAGMAAIAWYGSCLISVTINVREPERARFQFLRLPLFIPQQMIWVEKLKERDHISRRFYQSTNFNFFKAIRWACGVRKNLPKPRMKWAIFIGGHP